MEKKESFWVDSQLNNKLSKIPKNEKSTIIRMALREWFSKYKVVNETIDDLETAIERRSDGLC